jgi:hypothetical protein
MGTTLLFVFDSYFLRLAVSLVAGMVLRSTIKDSLQRCRQRAAGRKAFGDDDLLVPFSFV